MAQREQMYMHIGFNLTRVSIYFSWKNVNCVVGKNEKRGNRKCMKYSSCASSNEMNEIQVQYIIRLLKIQLCCLFHNVEATLRIAAF